MTVKELKNLLRKYPDSLTVHVHDMDGDFSNIIKVAIYKNDEAKNNEPLYYIFLESENEGI